jgi:TetR/AcrR family transcriptional repressor of lmrAB and yxaGH operons
MTTGLPSGWIADYDDRSVIDKSRSGIYLEAMAKETRRRIITKAAELLQRGGYHGTGVHQLSVSGSLPRGSLYFHFPGGKEEVAAAALNYAGEQFRAALEQTFYSAPTVGASLVAVLRALGQRLQASEWRDGSPIATTTLEVASDSELIRTICSRIYAGWARVIAERMIADGVAPDRAEQLATVALAGIEGALLLARAHRSTAPLEAMASTLPHLVAP